MLKSPIFHALAAIVFSLAFATALFVSDDPCADNGGYMARGACVGAEGAL